MPLFVSSVLRDQLQKAQGALAVLSKVQMETREKVPNYSFNLFCLIIPLCSQLLCRDHSPIISYHPRRVVPPIKVVVATIYRPV